MKRIEPGTDWRQSERIKHTYEREVLGAISGATFDIDKEDGRARNIHLGNGECAFYVSYDKRSHRFHFSVGGVYSNVKDAQGNRKSFHPGDLYPRPLSLEISVSADKSIEQIVKDFNRRFLPEFLRLQALIVEARNKSDNYLCNNRDAAAQLADECDGKVNRQSGSYSEYNYVRFPGGSAEVRSADSIKFEFCVSNVEQAALIASLLNKFESEKKEES